MNNILHVGKLFTKVNHTLICLIPKKEIPDSVDDYRPVALCNVMYRIFSKLLANRLKPLLPKLTDFNHTAFISGRRITDSILLAYELCHNLHSIQGRGRMCIKIDLSKAFDSLNMDFICNALQCLGFECKWVSWMHECMNHTFSILINGVRSPTCASSNRVRHGDPISPYLFALAMQVLTAMFQQAESRKELDPISCGTSSVSYICFADDLMIFLCADKKNAHRLKLLLDDFSNLLGLKINNNKSVVYFRGNTPHRKWITTHLELNAGELLVRYLGLPFISKRLSAKECSPLLQAVGQRLQSGKAKLLSYAGRMELIKSILLAMHLY